MKVQTFIIHACSALAIGQLVLARHSSLSEWTLYKKQHGKVYEEPEEDARRFSLFLAAKDRIANHNRNASSSYKLGLNHLSDWTQEELNKLTGLGNGRENIQQSAEADEFLRQLMSDNEQPVPKEVDWRKVPNRVSSVKDQLQCSSSWAFAAIGALEGQQVVRNFTRELIDLSAQDLVDCSSTNQNCVFGRAHFAFADISRMQGVNSESDYPYEGSFNSDRGCRFKKDQVVMSDRGSLYFYNDEAIIQKLVAQFGPVAVSVRAEPWIFYKTGIFDDATECVYKDTDHQALVVGYGTDPKLGDYWIIKNSWSKNWGEQGYIRLRRGKGMCGIGKESAIPKFDKTE